MKPTANQTTDHPVVPSGPPPFPLTGNQLQTFVNFPGDLSSKCKEYLQLLRLTYVEAKKYEAETHKQADCAKWHQLRKPRLTASTFGKICLKVESSRAKSSILAKKLLRPEQPTKFAEKMMKWGRDHEEIAVQVYRGIHQRNHVTLFENGIFISSEELFLAATPDRVCYDKTEEFPWGLVEVKCPYRVRESTPLKAAREIKTFCSSQGEDGYLHLKRDHEYFVQVQGHMALTGARWCDFVIYTKHGLSVERISFDCDFWKLKASPLHTFFFKYYQPMYISIQETVFFFN